MTIFSMCAVLHYWAGLYSGEEDRDRIKGGADQLMARASELAAQLQDQGRQSST